MNSLRSSWSTVSHNFKHHEFIPHCVIKKCSFLCVKIFHADMHFHKLMRVGLRKGLCIDNGCTLPRAFFLGSLLSVQHTLCRLMRCASSCQLRVSSHTAYLREICDDEVVRCVILEVLINLLLSNHLPLLKKYTKSAHFDHTVGCFLNV